VLETRVEVLRVFPDDDQVDLLVSRSDARKALYWPEICEKVERFAKPDVDAGEPAADRSRDGTFEGDAVAPDGLEQRGRQRVAESIHGGSARLVPLPPNSQPGAFEDLDNGGRNLGPDAVAGD
jgi:hypothetical protein